jgi:hypothetical protein
MKLIVLLGEPEESTRLSEIKLQEEVHQINTIKLQMLLYYLRFVLQKRDSTGA